MARQESPDDKVSEGAAIGDGVRDSAAISQVEDDANPSPILTDNALTTFAVRAIVIVLVCGGAWASCWIRWGLGEGDGVGVVGVPVFSYLCNLS